MDKDNILEDYVTAGINLLDEVEPDWRSKLDLPNLDMSHFMHCILPQVFGDFTKGACILYRFVYPKFSEYEDDYLIGEDLHEFEVQHGFETDIYFSYAQLQDIWMTHLKGENTNDR